MSWVATAVAGGSAVLGYMGSRSQSRAASSASREQIESQKAAIEEQRRQFDTVRELLAPYVEAGETALTSQLGLAGLGGEGVQERMIQRIEESPQFEAITRQGEEAILQRAAATGGLRGGNVQAALAQFRPQVLSNLMESRYNQLAGLSSIGQSAAAGVGSVAQQTGMNVSNLLQQQGAARAGGILGQGQATSQLLGALGQGIGFLGGTLSNNAPVLPGVPGSPLKAF